MPHRRPRKPERVYRDVWLIALSIVLGLLAIDALDIAAASRQAAHQAQHASALAVGATKAIQRQRVETILTSCESQNDEHARAVHELAVLFPPTSKARHVTRLLIDQLAPYQNCAVIARRATSKPASLPPIIQTYPPLLPPRKAPPHPSHRPFPSG